jgi:hypothetical protein
LVAVLNSTLVGLFKTFYGRYAGTEGNLKTEVVDVRMLEVPDPRGAFPEVKTRLASALRSMQSRNVGRLVEEQLMDCHSPERARTIAAGPVVLADELKQKDRRELDDAVFELIGVSSSRRRQALVDQLHQETAIHLRSIRVVEIQKMEQRAKTATKKFRPDELARDAWDAFEGEKEVSVGESLLQEGGSKIAIAIPDASPAYLPGESHMFDSLTVFFGKDRRRHITCLSREHAELVHLLAEVGVHGDVVIPQDPSIARDVSTRLLARLEQARITFDNLASSRTGDDRIKQQVVELLLRWFVQGGSTK